MKELLNQQGYVILKSILREDAIVPCREEIERVKQNTEFRGGFRRATEISQILSDVAMSAEISGLLETLGYPDAFLVRSIVFDKTPDSNWKVSWHQDTKIPVKERKEVEGYSSWSTKDGIPHVQPPSHILESMITLRIHFDETPDSNGALKVVPGSHRRGIINQSEIKELLDGEIICECSCGDIVAMNPLILHSSSPSTSPDHRRVLHLEFATSKLDTPLEWN